MSFCASPSRRYERKTDIEVTCPWGSSPSPASSSLGNEQIVKLELFLLILYFKHFCQNISDDSSFMVFSHVRYRGPSHSMVQIYAEGVSIHLLAVSTLWKGPTIFHRVILRKILQIACLHTINIIYLDNWLVRTRKARALC